LSEKAEFAEGVRDTNYVAAIVLQLARGSCIKKLRGQESTLNLSPPFLRLRVGYGKPA
jgi:hypothetical protein